MQTLQSVKIDLFKNRIFVFTPKGDVIELPEGSSPIDFAYAVHAQLGDHCRGAIVNDMPAELDRKLRSHDVVQIITGDKPCVNKNWLKIVLTRRAKKYIKEATKTYAEKIFGN
jgi:GTP pyrophosphokinase